LTFLAARDHPLAKQEHVAAAEIGRAGLITAPLTDIESVFYRNVLRDFGLTGDHAVLEIEGFQSRLLAAAAGCGVIATFVPHHVRAAVSDDLVPLAVDSPPATVAAGLVWRADDPTVAEPLGTWLRAHVSG
jgi:DNA-binding transcriptional LysR family regulator